MRAESMNCLVSVLLVGLDRRTAAVLADALVLDLAGDERKERVVTTDAHTGPRRDPGASLTDQDRARVDALAAVDLDAQHLRVRVPAVARAASTLLVCHLLRFLLGAPSRRLRGRFFFLRFCHRLRRGCRLRASAGRCLLRRPGSGLLCGRALGLVFLCLFLFLGLETDSTHGDDLQRRQVRASAVVDPHPFLRLVANALDARSAPVVDDPGVDVEALEGRTDLHLAAVGEKHKGPELHGGARLRAHAVDQDPVTGGDSVLLAAAYDDSRKRTIRLGHGDELYESPPHRWGGGAKRRRGAGEPGPLGTPPSAASAAPTARARARPAS